MRRDKLSLFMIVVISYLITMSMVISTLFVIFKSVTVRALIISVILSVAWQIYLIYRLIYKR